MGGTRRMGASVCDSSAVSGKTSDKRRPSKEEESSSWCNRVHQMVFELVKKKQAGVPVRRVKKSMKVIMRLTPQETKNLMAMPWPVPDRPIISDSFIDAIKDPVCREQQRAAKAHYLAVKQLCESEAARMRDQYINHGYAEMAIRVDEDGNEWMVPL